MQRRISFIVSFLLIFSLLARGYAQQSQTIIYEDFKDLENWRPFYFQRIKTHTQYCVIKENEKTYLKAESNASASAIIYKKEFNVYEYPRIKWKWKVDNIYHKGNIKKKSGDDYPLRIYVIFKYDPTKASFGKKIKYGLAKMIYGEYPPHSSLNYIWANRNDEKGIATNPYTDEVRMIILEAGSDRIGQWVEEDVNIVDDYRKAFGTDPPSIASIAIMNDSDNTGENSISYIDYIEVYNERAPINE